jgi:3-methyladenine DNA glycosylase Mpg
VLDAGFFDRSAEEVAVSLLGCYLVKDKKVSRIVETEAYFGESDPGSRAKSG